MSVADRFPGQTTVGWLLRLPPAFAPQQCRGLSFPLFFVFQGCGIKPAFSVHAES